MKKMITSLTLAIALAAPVSLLAQDRHDDHDRNHDDRGYYDAHHKDYHHWDAREDRAYHMYWEQHHHAYIDWNRASARQQRDYWNWRHNHSDALLQINVR